MDAATVRLAIQTRNREIEQLMAHTPVDSLAVEELLAANQRDVRALRTFTAQNIVNAAPHRQIQTRPDVTAVLDRHTPRLPDAFATRYLKGAI
jgi:hypothetical protein